jgi:DNA-binding response OmpR family regulator
MVCPRIFVVNDEAPLRHFFQFNLHARGFDVIATMSHPDVFKSIQEASPELVILDLMICGTDGFELCRQVCQSTTSSVIAFNMRGGESDLLRCLDMGVDDYLSRPIGVNELMARINAVLRHRKWAKSPEPV